MLARAAAPRREGYLDTQTHLAPKPHPAARSPPVAGPPRCAHQAPLATCPQVLVSLDPKVEIASAVGPGGQSVEPPLFVYAAEQVSFDVLPPLPRKQKPVPAQLPGAAGVEKKLRLFLTKCSEASAVWGVQAAEDIRVRRRAHQPRGGGAPDAAARARRRLRL